MTATRQGFRRERARPLEFDRALPKDEPLVKTRKYRNDTDTGRNLSRSFDDDRRLAAGQRARAERLSELPHRTVHELYALQEGRCFHCREEMLATPYRKTGGRRHNNGWTREHLVPKSRGGGNGRNIVLAHFVCNGKKGDRMPTVREIEVANALHDGEPLRRFPQEDARCQK